MIVMVGCWSVAISIPQPGPLGDKTDYRQRVTVLTDRPNVQFLREIPRL